MLHHMQQASQNTLASQQGPPDPNLFGSNLLSSLGNFGKSGGAYEKFLNDAGGRYPANIAANRLTPAEYYNLANQYGFYNQLQPEEHNALFSMLNYMANPELMAGQYQQGADARATQQLPQLQASLASSGAGQGAKEGAALHVGNEAQRAGNAYAANLFSPEGTAQRAQTISGIYNQAQPDYSRLQSIANITGGTPVPQSGLSTLGNIAGGFMGLGKLF